MKIKQGNIKQAVAVHSEIPEFEGGKPAEEQYFQERYENKENVIFIAFENEKSIGYMISYDRYNDNSIYCWMAGVVPKHREQKVLSKMMLELENWAKEKNYRKIKIKTSNKRKAMLTYLVKNNFLISKVYNETTEKEIKDNRINLEKEI